MSKELINPAFEFSLSEEGHVIITGRGESGGTVTLICNDPVELETAAYGFSKTADMLTVLLEKGVEAAAEKFGLIIQDDDADDDTWDDFHATEGG